MRKLFIFLLGSVKIFSQSSLYLRYTFTQSVYIDSPYYHRAYLGYAYYGEEAYFSLYGIGNFAYTSYTQAGDVVVSNFGGLGLDTQYTIGAFSPGVFLSYQVGNPSYSQLDVGGYIGISLGALYFTLSGWVGDTSYQASSNVEKTQVKQLGFSPTLEISVGKSISLLGSYFYVEQSIIEGITEISYILQEASLGMGISLGDFYMEIAPLYGFPLESNPYWGISSYFSYSFSYSLSLFASADYNQYLPSQGIVLSPSQYYLYTIGIRYEVDL